MPAQVARVEPYSCLLVLLLTVLDHQQIFELVTELDTRTTDNRSTSSPLKRLTQLALAHAACQTLPDSRYGHFENDSFSFTWHVPCPRGLVCSCQTLPVNSRYIPDIYAYMLSLGMIGATGPEVWRIHTTPYSLSRSLAKLQPSWVQSQRRQGLGLGANP